MKQKENSHPRSLQPLALDDALERIQSIRLPPLDFDENQFREELALAVRHYYEIKDPSEIASAAQRFYKSGLDQDLSVIAPYLPSGVDAPSKLIRGERIEMRGGRPRRRVELALQSGKGFPGRGPELVLVSRVAAAWARCGQAVVRGWDDATTPFEALIEDLLVALMLDDKVSAKNLVRTHIANRNSLAND